eukprot:2229159-Prymnesium_polylepis.1
MYDFTVIVTKSRTPPSCDVQSFKSNKAPSVLEIGRRLEQMPMYQMRTHPCLTEQTLQDYYTEHTRRGDSL